jgi:hypothetical protein
LEFTFTGAEELAVRLRSVARLAEQARFQRIMERE